MQVGTKLDWGSWGMGWMGSLVIKEIQDKHVILVSYFEECIVKGITKRGKFIRETEIKWTHKELAHRIEKRVEQLRLTDKTVDLAQCTVIPFN